MSITVTVGPDCLDSLFESYVDICEFSKQLSPQTIKGYRDVYQTFRKVMPEIISTKDLNATAVHQFFKRIATRKRDVGSRKHCIGVKHSTIRTYYNKLILFIRWLEENGHLDGRELSQNISKPNAPVYEDERALSQDEVAKIIASITMHSIHNGFLYKRDLTIVNILLYTGIRKGELLGLRVQDVDFSTRTLFINGQTSKSKKSRRIPLSSLLIMHLRTYLEERNKRKSTCPYLLISNNRDAPLTHHGIKHWVEKYRSRSGVQFHLHRFRHTFACNLAKNNADIVSIKNVMGHSSIKMTEKYLRSIGSENARAFIEALQF